MSIEEAYNRGNNLVATAIASLAGFAFLPETILEPEIPFKIDDIALFLTGITAIAWYRKGNNRFTRSFKPVLLVFFGLVIKIAAIMVEIKDKEDVGDDFGGMILFVLATLFVLWLYFKSKKVKENS